MKEAGKWTEYQASLFKSVITLLFFGRLRSAEALADNNKHYDLLINLLRSDVVFNKNDEGKITHVTLLLRACKYQEEVGACVVIPAIPGKDFCPVRALREYLKQRKTKTRNFDLPLFITECVWSKGSSKPDWTSPGLLTKAKFKNDTDNAVRELTKHQPNLQEVYAYLYSHSLRSGIPTELQQIPDLPEEIKLLLGRWHSSAHQIYAKSIAEANKAALIVQQSVIKLAQTKPTKTIEKENRDELYD